MAKHRADTPQPGTPETRARMIILEFDKLQRDLHSVTQHARSIASRIESDNTVRMNGAQIDQIKGTVDLTLHAVVEARESWIQIYNARKED